MERETKTISVHVPDKLLPIFELGKYRYKTMYGGRGGGKSWGVVDALVTLASATQLRILCAREIQDSIKNSVKQLIEDTIRKHGLENNFDILEREIRGANGSLFYFSGLASHTVDSIKSFEGVDIVWVEEAQSVSKRSWDILTPTIRKPGSEIWITFNPDLDTDEVWTRFVLNPPPKSLVISVNYYDNPWFTEELELERQHCEISRPDDYKNIWLGVPRSARAGAIYAGEITKAMIEERVRPVPYDPKLKVHTVWDMGWNDSMTIILVQRGMAEFRVVDYIEESHKTLEWYAAELAARRMNWGFDWLPHDAFTRDYKTGKTASEILTGFGRKIKRVPNIGVENGIKSARALLDRTYFDKVKASRLIECLRNYSRTINSKTSEEGDPVHDQYSHGADCYRYLSVVSDYLTNESDESRYKPIDGFVAHDPIAGY